MLSAFTARPIIELKQRNKSKIETILAYGDRVLVGLNTGALRVYRVNEIPGPIPAAYVAQPSNGHAAKSPSKPPLAVDDDGNGLASPPPSQQTPPVRAAPVIKPTDLLREIERFSPRAIEQLAIIKEANTLVSLSNYAVSLHDLQTLEPLDPLTTAPLPRTKNASLFAVTSNIVRDPTTHIPEIISRLAVAVKHHLLLWTWHESELVQDGGDGGDGVVEIVLSKTIRSITWASATRLVCGMNSGYVVVHVDTREVEDVIGPGTIGPTAGASGAAAAAAAAVTGTNALVQGGGSRFGAISTAGMGYVGLGGYTPTPLATKLAEGEMLLARDTNTLFIDEKGKALENKKQIPWQAAPEAIGYSYPYILALQAPSKGSVEVRNPDTLSLLQTISLPAAAALHFPPPTVSLAHAGKGFHALSERIVWKMDATDYDSQVDELVSQGHFDEAISILSMLEDALLRNKTETVREVKMLKAEWLFRQKKYRASMDLFNEDDVRAPPERVLKLYPHIIAGDLSGVEEEKSGEPGSGEAADDKPANGEKTDTATSKTDSPSDLIPSPQKTGGFAKYLLAATRMAAPSSDTASIVSSRREAQENDDAVSVRNAKARDDQAREEKELKEAVQELCSYLVGTRTRLQRIIDPRTGKLVPRKPPSDGSVGANHANTTAGGDEAFRTLLLTTSSWKGESDQSLERELQQTYRVVDTALFRSYMFSSPTLTGNLLRLPNFCDPDVVHERLVAHNRFQELVDFFYGKRLHRQALELLRKFGSWSPDEGDSPPSGDDAALANVPPALRGPHRTVIYLQNLPSEMADLILEFSEWTLRKEPDLAMDEVFLADSENAETLPRDKVAAFLGGIDVPLEMRYLEHAIFEWNDMTPDFHNRLVELLIKRLGETRKDGTEQSDEWRSLMEKLVQFLGQSKQYSLTWAAQMIPNDDPLFFEADAVILSSKGKHKEALEVYVFKMRDYARAEEYCNRIYKSQSPSASPVRTNTLAALAGASRRISPYGILASTSPPTARSMDSNSIAGHVPGGGGGLGSNGDDDGDDEEGTSQRTSIYHTLLALYLTPPPPHQPDLAPALDLLSRHGSRLAAASTLGLIPDSLPVSALEPYFRGRMRSANSVINETRVAAGLRKTQLVNTQAALLLLGLGGVVGAGPGVGGFGGGGFGGGGSAAAAAAGRNRRVVVGEDRVCGVCHKRLGGSVIAVMPDNAVVHYGCMGKTAGSAVTQGAAGGGSSSITGSNHSGRSPTIGTGGGGWGGGMPALSTYHGSWGRGTGIGMGGGGGGKIDFS